MRLSSLLVFLGLVGHLPAAEKKEQPMTPGGVYRAHDMQRPRPQVISPPGFSTHEKAGSPPSDAKILFDGKDLSHWKREPRKDSGTGDDKPQWKVENGYMEIVGRSGSIRTRDTFKGDGHLHLEWATPATVAGNGQGRGNSGVFIGGFPEIQVLDSYQNDTYPDGQASGLYSHYPPMVNASRKPGEWQTYDIFFERAKPGAKAKLTVIHNGIVVHFQREFDSIAQEGDLMLQDHLNPVRFRNIWLRPLRVDSDKAGLLTPAKAAIEIKKSPGSAPLKIIRIKTMTAQMKYDQNEFVVRPGEAVKVIFENGDDLPHNIVFCQPGTDTAAMALKQMENVEAALKRNWVPDDKRVWLHSKMLNPHEEEALTFTAPEKAGDYPFVCTFPGHALTMNGKMKVLPLGDGLKDLKFALYQGAWKSLPDFSKLKPHREGMVEDNLIQIKLDDYKNEFGVVFTGKLHAPRKGSYRFYITGDDGVRLLVDGKNIVEFDGIHPAGDIKEGSAQLEEGLHDFRLEYFQAGGDIAVFAAWKGSHFDITPLSKWTPKGWEKGAKPKQKKDFDPIPLVVKNEPVIYRNFIAGAGNRGIAVGYPGGISVAWSAEQMNLALIWRGAFMDASKHWNSRGGGYQAPLGYDVLSPSQGQPFAILATPEAAWPEKQERAPGYAWKGYRLDTSRHPTFLYEWNGLKVADRCAAAPNQLQRTLKIDGQVPANMWLRIASGKIEAKDGGFLIDAGKLNLEGRAFENKLRITAAGARIVGGNLLLPITGSEVSVTYSWPQ
ncbi:family 16 glycoside hydrolase [Prosthecobacter dejongeii]|uniref:Azurin n=1 Tax=Prosthecobacter dejongeii TaxID=48465 RepID=A0A7W7YMY1_9BACT|nr:family 16 glycoside hydrolase [Prosthecobacter dejongeii]MBB5039133.1 azurin [Prosthecobacter dejongeii]